MDDNPRKKMNASSNAGKVGEQAVELLLTRAQFNVQRVSNENDIGRDLYVDLTRSGEVTGGVVAIQVRSIIESRRDGRWLLPYDDKDFTLWLESNIPMFGVLYCRADESMRWVNLCDFARREQTRDKTSKSYMVDDAGFGKHGVILHEDNRLDLSTARFWDAAEGAIRQFPLVGIGSDLVGESVERAQRAVLDCFAVGRHDARPLLLLAACLRWLPLRARRDAIIALSHAGHHPDIFWHEANWISDLVKLTLHTRVSWSEEDIEAMFATIEDDVDGGGAGWGRGSLGQCVYHTLGMDRQIAVKVRRVFSHSNNISTLEDAALLTQYWAEDDAPKAMSEMQHERLDAFASSGSLAELARMVLDHGWVDIF